MSEQNAIPLTDAERLARRGKSLGSQVICTNCKDPHNLQPDFEQREFTCISCGAVMDFHSMTVLRFNKSFIAKPSP